MIRELKPEDLTVPLHAGAAGYSDTSQLAGGRIGWIGQARAEKAASFGLAVDQPGYNLFVLGESGCGRSTLMLQAKNVSENVSENNLPFLKLTMH